MVIKYCKMAMPHLLLIVSLFMGTFWILDQLNPQMEFLSNAVVRTVQIILIVIAGAAGFGGIWHQCKEKEDEKTEKDKN